jgi:hypothetical protein
MPPFFVLAHRYAQASLPDLAHSALPGAPVQPYVERRRRLRRLLVAVRARSAAPARRREPVECVPAT